MGPVNETRGGADALTPHSVVVLRDRPVVALSPALAEALAECGPRVLQIVTSPASRLTIPLRTLVGSPKATWVVAPGDGYYEGLTGRPMRWDGTAFTHVPDATDYAPTYKTRPSTPLGSHLTLTFQARPAENPGAHIEHLLHLITGHPPLGWGPTEPLKNPWKGPRLPRAPHLILTGKNAIATLNFSGETETTTLVVAYPPSTRPPITDLPPLIDALTTKTPITALMAQLSPGRPDLTTEPRWSGAASPIGLAAAGARTGPPGFTRQRLGPPSAPLTWFPLGDGRSPDYWHRHHQLLTHLNNPAH